MVKCKHSDENGLHRGSRTIDRKENSFMPSSPLLRRLVLFGTPLSLSLLELTHPTDPATAPAHADWWLILHMLTFVLFPLMALAVFLLLDGAGGRAAWLSRRAMLVYAVVYSGYIGMDGLAGGVLLQQANGLPAAQQADLMRAILGMFNSPVGIAIAIAGTLAWIVGNIAMAVALFHAGARRAPLVLLAIGSCVLLGDHPVPAGPIAFGAFLIAVVWIELGQRPALVTGTQPKQASQVGRSAT